MSRSRTTVLVLFAWGAALPSLAAEPRAVVEMTDGVFHTAVCPGPVAPGTARCHAHVVTDALGRRRVAAATPGALPAGYGPADLRSAYNVTGSGASTTLIAVIDAYGYPGAESDLAMYRATFGLAPCTSASGCLQKVNEYGAASPLPKPRLGWEDESAIDLAMASAICPNCRLLLVEAASASNADLATAVNTAAMLGAAAISNSYGGPEAGTQMVEPDYDHPGVAITASTGDKGYADGVQFPASSPHVTAVGGTSLNPAANARGWSETAWKSGGSGCSAIYAKPAWQTDPLCSMRMIADVSAVANPATGIAVYAPTSTGSTWQVYGGTSVSAPLIAGLYAVNGGAAAYGSDPYANLGALNDVTTGKNGKCAVSYFCTAQVGYDGPTGLGTPNGVNAF